jgi:hypothetical protein
VPSPAARVRGRHPSICPSCSGGLGEPPAQLSATRVMGGRHPRREDFYTSPGWTCTRRRASDTSVAGTATPTTQFGNMRPSRNRPGDQAA